MDIEQRAHPDSTLTREEALRRADKKALLRLRRNADTEDVSYLNITAMMDMMTILLVFMLKSFSSQSDNVILTSQLALPASGTADELAESTAVTIAKNAVLVDGEPVVGVTRGNVDASEKGGGNANEMTITSLYNNLKERSDFYKKIAQMKKKPFDGALTIIADKTTPYRLLTEVMYTAGKAEYQKYRLVVLEKEE